MRRAHVRFMKRVRSGFELVVYGIALEIAARALLLAAFWLLGAHR